jgi:uncharacterized protein
MEMLQTVAKLFTVLGAIYALMVLVIYVRQEQLIFHPDKLDSETKFNFADTREVTVPVDGASLSALHMQLPNAKGVVFYLHGNGGSLASWFPGTSDFFRRANFDLFMIDYRGYGKSTGQITSEAQLHGDVQKAFEQVAPQYSGKPVVILGRSIGTGIAIELARRIKPPLTILVSPYTSLADLASQRFSWAPTSLMRYPLRTMDRLKSFTTPVLLLHGGKDQVIPVGHSQALSAAQPQAELVIIPAAEHNDMQDFPEYARAILKRLNAL